jgi:hypothetical protein
LELEASLRLARVAAEQATKTLHETSQTLRRARHPAHDHDEATSSTATAVADQVARLAAQLEVDATADASSAQHVREIEAQLAASADTRMELLAQAETVSEQLKQARDHAA